jgi:hypothetical protein
VRFNATRVLSALLVIIGLAMIVRTALEGGGQVGFVLGPLFCALGAGRLYLSRGG